MALRKDGRAVLFLRKIEVTSRGRNEIGRYPAAGSAKSLTPCTIFSFKTGPQGRFLNGLPGGTGFSGGLDFFLGFVGLVL